jgi:guanylate kinase
MNSETKTGKCIIFSAPSGAGKTTIVKELLNKIDLKLEFSISATTRQPRGSEINGKEYYYLTVDEFKSAIEKNAFVEWEEVYENNFYGTLKSELERIWLKGSHVIFDVDVKGGINLKHKFGKNALSIFIQPPSLNILEQRLRNRGTDTEEKIKQRIEKAEYELSFASQFDNQIINNVLNKSIAEAERITRQFLLQ